MIDQKAREFLPFTFGEQSLVLIVKLKVAQI